MMLSVLLRLDMLTGLVMVAAAAAQVTSVLKSCQQQQTIR
jgi:hypothetical protein